MKPSFFLRITAALLVVVLCASYLPKITRAEGSDDEQEESIDFDYSDEETTGDDEETTGDEEETTEDEDNTVTTITESVTWSHGTTLGNVTVRGGTSADNPVVITIMGNVNLTGQIWVESGYVVFSGYDDPNEGTGTLNNEAGYAYDGDSFAMIRVADGANVIVNPGDSDHLSMAGCYGGSSKRIKYGIYKEGTSGSLTVQRTFMIDFERAAVYGAECISFCTFDHTEIGVDGPSDLLVRIENTTFNYNRTAIANCKAALSSCYTSSGSLYDDQLTVDRGGSSECGIFLSGPLWTNLSVNIKNMALSSEGEVILAQPYGSYAITAEDAAKFSYTASWSEYQLSFSDPYLTASGNVATLAAKKPVINVIKVYVVQPDCGTAVSLTTDENSNVIQSPSPIITVPEDAHYSVSGQRYVRSEYDWSSFEGDIIDCCTLFFNIVNDGTICFGNSIVIDINDGEWLVGRSDGDDTGFAVLATIPAIHNFGDWTESSEDPGYETRVCSRCDTTERRRVVTALGARLVLEGQIVVQYIMKDYDPDNTVATAVISRSNGSTVTRTVSGIRDSAKENVYLYNIPMAAKEMADNINLSFTDIEGEPVTLITSSGKELTGGADYSVNTYLKNKAGDSDAELVALCDAMKAYGQYSQLFFGYRTDLIEDQMTLDQVSETDLASYKASRTGTEPEGITVSRVNMVLESETTINYWLSLSAGYSVNDYTYTLNGSSVTPVQDGEDWVIRKQNIVAKDLDVMQTLVISNGSDTVTYRYGAMTYCYNIIRRESSSEDLRNLCAAMYLYNRAADVYFGQRDGD